MRTSRFRVDDSVAQRLGRESGKNDGVDGTDSSTSLRRGIATGQRTDEGRTLRDGRQTYEECCGSSPMHGQIDGNLH